MSNKTLLEAGQKRLRHHLARQIDTFSQQFASADSMVRPTVVAKSKIQAIGLATIHQAAGGMDSGEVAEATS